MEVKIIKRHFSHSYDSFFNETFFLNVHCDNHHKRYLLGIFIIMGPDRTETFKELLHPRLRFFFNPISFLNVPCPHKSYPLGF